MRALFLCGGEVIAAGVLKGWLDAGHDVAEIWHASPTLRRAQRTLNRFAPDWSVYRLAQRHGIPTFAIPPLRKWPDAVPRIASIRADVLITAMTMQIVPETIIAHFAGRAANVHPALLPNYRGPAPFLAQLVDGRENECGGVTLHQLTPAIDEGPIIAQTVIPFDSVDRNYATWRVAAAFAARRLSREALPRFFEGTLAAVPQGPGSYRRVVGDLIHAGSSFADAERLVARIGPTGRLRAANRNVRGGLRRLGAPTGQPPQVGPFSVALDIADARIRLTRWNALDDLWLRRDQLAAIRKFERQSQL